MELAKKTVGGTPPGASVDRQPPAPGVTGTKKKIAHRCGRCKKEFSREDSLQRHLAKARPCDEPPAPRPRATECERCGKAFISKGNRDRHVRGGKCGSARGRPTSHTTNNNHTTNNDNRTTINAHITVNIGEVGGGRSPRDFGDEFLAFLTEKVLQRELLGALPTHLRDPEAEGRWIVSRLLHLLYANADHRENLTVVRGGPRSEPLVMANGRWATAPLAELADRMAAKVLDLIKTVPLKARVGADHQAIRWIRGDGGGRGEFDEAAKAVMRTAHAVYLETGAARPRLGGLPAPVPPPAPPRAEDLGEAREAPQVIAQATIDELHRRALLKLGPQAAV